MPRLAALKALALLALAGVAGGCLQVGARLAVSATTGSGAGPGNGTSGTDVSTTGVGSGTTSGAGARSGTSGGSGSGPISDCGAQPDGTRCTLWWEPCVSDSVCRGGQCRSLTAEAEVPGQIRWQVPLNKVSGPMTVDAAGNSTFRGAVTASDGALSLGIYAFDACGNLRWTEGAYSWAEVASDGEQLIAVAAAQRLEDSATPGDSHLIALSPSTGATLWDIDLNTLQVPAELSDAGPLRLIFAGPSVSNAGLITLAIGFEDLSSGDGYGVQIASFTQNGGLAWRTNLIPGSLWLDPTVDALGQLYVPIFGTSSEVLWSGSALGETLFEDQGLRDLGALAAGVDFVSSEGFGAIGADGGTLYSFPFQYNGNCTSTQIIDATGAVFAPAIALDAGEPSLFALSPDGEIEWRRQMPAAQTMALSDDGTLFSASTYLCSDYPGDGGVALVALSSDGGALLWQTVLPDSPNAAASLALTPHSTLLTCGTSTVYAIFAGKEQPSSTAPWSRDHGDNDGRNCARAIR